MGGLRRKKEEKRIRRGTERDRGAPENGDLRVSTWVWVAGQGFSADGESSSSLSPHRYIRRQRDAPALVRTGPPTPHRSRIYGPFYAAFTLFGPDSNLIL